MSKFEQIEAFINVVQENSFAAAARKLNLSTAAISRQVSRLETSLGAQLLTRTTRQITLTEIGAEYYKHCQKALAEIREGDALILGAKAEPTGMLNITSNRHFANKFLIPKLGEFIKLYPKLILNIELAERFPDFTEENIDILFGVSLEGPSHLVRKRIAKTNYILAASPAYLKKKGIPKTPNELIHHDYITHSMRPDTYIYFCGDKKISMQPILCLNDCQAMLECAVRDMGIILLHDYMVRDTIKKGLLIEILPEFKVPEKSVYLYYQPQRYLQPKIRYFIDYFTRKI
ncbi:MAG: LysR family transcriptional regulator [Gammaproteobacteria bacterium]|nr:LysR family transcriptional regulator [Gammaproteobacteria bacterium]